MKGKQNPYALPTAHLHRTSVHRNKRVANNSFYFLKPCENPARIISHAKSPKQIPGKSQTFPPSFIFIRASSRTHSGSIIWVRFL